MKTIFEILIIDFHKKLKEERLPEIVKRDTEILSLSSKISSVIGVRRSGKTWLIFQKIIELLNSGVSEEFILYLNFEDERLIPLGVEEMNTLIKTYYSLYPHVIRKKKYFFLDEIQNIQGWEKFLRRIIDNENVEIYITGSSAKLLSKEIATSLRGRSITTEVYPLSFREFLKFRMISPPSPQRLGSEERALLSHQFLKYMEIGGFPEIQKYSDFERIKILQEYMNSIIMRDVLERYNLKNIHLLKIIVKHAINNPATLFSVNKLFNHLRSIGIRADKNYVYEIINYLEDAFFLFLIKKHSQSEKVKQINPSKIYLIDHGIVIANSKKPEPDWGRLLENIVFLHLKREFLEIEYYKDNGFEIDFIIFDPLKKIKTAIQVSYSVENEETFSRELKGLKEILRRGIVKRGILLTVDDSEKEIKAGDGKIYILPVWKFLLNSRDFLQ